MNTWLLIWNPARWSWDDLGTTARKIQRGDRHRSDQWSCARNKSIRRNDRIFLIRLGQEPRGIIGAGWASSKPSWEDAWDGKPNNKRARYIKLEWDSLLHEAQDPFPISTLKRPPFAKMHWSPQASGITISPEIASKLEHAWALHYKEITESSPLQVDPATNVSNDDQIDEEISAFEGVVRTLFVRHRQRESWLRDQKILESQRLGTLKCEVAGCGFDFEQTYGRLGAGFVEVHHRRGLARSGPTKTKLADLAIVCANCHRMIHRGGKCRGLGFCPSHS